MYFTAFRKAAVSEFKNNLIWTVVYHYSKADFVNERGLKTVSLSLTAFPVELLSFFSLMQVVFTCLGISSNTEAKEKGAGDDKHIKLT